MIAHEPWVGNRYGTGLVKHAGQKIAIVGYSHYTDEADNEKLTINTVESVVSGEKKHRFFSAIPSWFGYDDLATFWDSVLFFNFLPNSVGTKEEKFADGTREQIIEAQRRFISILEEHQPDRVFVLSTKAWNNCPLTEGEHSGAHCTHLAQSPDKFSWGIYRTRGSGIKAFGMRHPMGADKEQMSRSVSIALAT